MKIGSKIEKVEYRNVTDFEIDRITEIESIVIEDEVITDDLKRSPSLEVDNFKLNNKNLKSIIFRNCYITSKIRITNVETVVFENCTITIPPYNIPLSGVKRKFGFELRQVNNVKISNSLLHFKESNLVFSDCEKIQIESSKLNFENEFITGFYDYMLQFHFSPSNLITNSLLNFTNYGSLLFFNYSNVTIGYSSIRVKFDKDMGDIEEVIGNCYRKSYLCESGVSIVDTEFETKGVNNLILVTEYPSDVKNVHTYVSDHNFREHIQSFLSNFTVECMLP